MLSSVYEFVDRATQDVTILALLLIMPIGKVVKNHVIKVGNFQPFYLTFDP